MRTLLMTLVRVYRWLLSPAKTLVFGPGSGCRHHPSCSAYALEALQVHGAARGSWLTLRRLARCHPWGTAGVDPVPPPRTTAGATGASSGAAPCCPSAST